MATVETAQSVPGQFEDCVTENDGDEDAVFVAMMREKIASSIKESRKTTQVTSCNDDPVEGECVDWEDDDDDDDEDFWESENTSKGNSSAMSSGTSKGNQNMNSMSFDSKKLNLDSRSGKSGGMSHSVFNAVTKMEHMESTKRTLHTGRDDRATSEQCLDPRTRLMLFRMLSTGFFELIDGCLSTGKEANVYYAKAGHVSLSPQSPTNITTKNNDENTENSNYETNNIIPDNHDDIQQQFDLISNKNTVNRNNNNDETATDINDNQNKPVTEYAVKIYKTSILVFKDRDKYVSGEHRWRKGYCKSNPRKMVKVWAEKEMRNYRRLHAASIPCPQPILLKNHILVMEFLGENGWPSPRLKDAQLSERRMRQAYVQTIYIMRHMYQRCRLVHGDLSEYNLLWHNNQVYVIDVSQSVESDHPSALDFLRKDASNVNDFFRKYANLSVMTTRQLFDFITSTVIDSTEEAESHALDVIMQQVDFEVERLRNITVSEQKLAKHKEEVDEAVFMSQFLPRSLNQVAECEIRKLEDGDVEESYARAVAALTGNEAVVQEVIQRQEQNQMEEEANYASNVISGVELEDPGRIAGDESEVDSDHLEQDIDDDDDDDDYDDNDDDESEVYVKKAMTPEEFAVMKEAKKAAMKAHKKAAKESQREHRLSKVKKKDKKRAIKKSKSKKK